MDRWIFGYGSLIWRPAFPYVERRPARIEGWSRRFWQASTDHRGTPERPGRVVTLIRDPGGHCWGMAYRVTTDQHRAALEILDLRESGGYDRLETRVWLQVLPDGATRVRRDGPPDDLPRESPVPGWVYIAAHDNPNYAGPAPLESIAEIVAQAHGPSGPNREYVVELARALCEMGAEDPGVTELAQRVSGPGPCVQSSRPGRSR